MWLLRVLPVILSFDFAKPRSFSLFLHPLKAMIWDSLVVTFLLMRMVRTLATTKNEEKRHW